MMIVLDPREGGRLYLLYIKRQFLKKPEVRIAAIHSKAGLKGNFYY